MKRERFWFTKYQWNFYRGWSNDFDFIRVALEWEDYQTAKLVLILLGLKFVAYFPLRNAHEYRRRLLEWWYPCPDCKGRFGKHDESVEHRPF